MNEQTQNNQPLEDQPEGTVPPTPGNQPPEAPPTRKFKLTSKFALGFLGWYLVTALFYGLLLRQNPYIVLIFVGLLFPVNVVMLILLLRKQPQIGWGMLSALGLNLAISLILGLTFSAVCFIPFFYNMK